MPEVLRDPGSYSVADSVSPDLKVQWTAARDLLPTFLTSVSVTPDTFTKALLLSLRSAREIDDSPTEVARKASLDGEYTLILTRGEGRSDEQFLLVPTKDVSEKDLHLAPFVEIHSRLVAWWLCAAWRSAELARSTWLLGDQYCVIAAAACARSFLETVAAFWSDARKLSEIWDSTKKKFDHSDRSLQGWRDLHIWLWQVQYGAKFNDRLPDLASAWKGLERANVLGQVEKLAKATRGNNLQEHYQWLCNTVHPSAGGTFAYSSPTLRHPTQSYSDVWYGPFPMAIHGPQAADAERTVQKSLITSTIVAVRVMTRVLDESLRIIDDVALTTKAPRFAAFDYWRRIMVSTRKQVCPCRSGRRAQDCRHRWGDAGPQVSERFLVGSEGA